MKIGDDGILGQEPSLSPTILVVDDEENARKVCAEVLLSAGFQPREASTTEQALEILDQFPIEIVITDLRVPEIGGIELLKRIKSEHPGVAVMVLAQNGTYDSAMEAARLGASEYVAKPFHIDDLESKLRRIVHEQKMDRENRLLREQLRTRPGFGSLVGASPKMQRVYHLIEKVSQDNYPVLILGESGTGKELVARSIHFLGPRCHKSFSPVDCSSIVSTLVESELFGYVKGAFTGALHSKQGLLESANGGTLFLDEIGDMPIDLQAKLLRALQEKEVKPVGSTERVRISIRVIAATNRNLENAVRASGFRQDLFFRLNVVQIKLPPLRERKSDIPLLVNTFLEKFSVSRGPLRTISQDAMTRLMVYDWPGNVRELENCIERAVALSSGPILHTMDLPSALQYEGNHLMPQGDDMIALDELERRAIFRALRESSGDKLAAAKLLGIGKTTLYRKLKQYNERPVN